MWMLVHAGQQDNTSPALKVISDQVLHFMVAMKRSGRRVKMDDAHGNVSASVLQGLCHTDVRVIGLGQFLPWVPALNCLATWHAAAADAEQSLVVNARQCC